MATAPEDKIVGTETDDILIGSAIADDIKGYGGNDVITGLDNDDLIDAGGGDKQVFGNEGNDLIRSDDGNDLLYGDTEALDQADSPDVLYGTPYEGGPVEQNVLVDSELFLAQQEIYAQGATTLNIPSLLHLMRPHQYVKNFFIFLPLFFGLQITDTALLLNAFIAFIAFSISASAIYTLNDYHDIEEDRQHPKKKKRPLASGAISKPQAIIVMSVLFILGFILIVSLSMQATYILLAYVGMNIAYSFYLKHIPIVDISTIAIGFVLRLFVGASVTGIHLSMWIVIMTFLLALFMALAKRRDDVLIYMETGKKMRKVIVGYNLVFLDGAMMIMSAVVIVSYVNYTTSTALVEQVGSEYLYLTAFFVIVGILRYMKITFVNKQSGSPTKIVLKDLFMQLILLGWIVSFAWIIY
jgi:decaprenyl-phosphate phosphoribosyltransferase